MLQSINNQFYNKYCRLHDGGFTDTTEDNEPAPPTWRSWMENIEEYKIDHDMKYSGNIPNIIFRATRSKVDQ